MHCTLVYVQVKPDRVAEFIAASETNHFHSILEPGNKRFDVMQQADDPTYFVLYEAYASAEAAAVHKETEHYRDWRDAVADWMASPRRGVLHHGLCMGETPS